MYIFVTWLRNGQNLNCYIALNKTVFFQPEYVDMFLISPEKYLFVFWFYGPDNPLGHVKHGHFT